MEQTGKMWASLLYHDETIPGERFGRQTRYAVCHVVVASCVFQQVAGRGCRPPVEVLSGRRCGWGHAGS